jgi:hypothetical protein
LCEENWILGEGNLDIGAGFQDISERFSSIGDLFPHATGSMCEHGFGLVKSSTHNLK